MSGASGPWAAGRSAQAIDATRLWAQASPGAGVEPPKPAAKRAASSGETLEPLPWYSANNLHKNLGLGAIALAGLTMISPKAEDGPHEYFARGSAALAVAAVATGLYAHWDDIDSSWSNPDTKHAVLGTLGALGILAAVAKGGKGDHAAYGGVGALSMVIAVKLTW
jgi:hypothetical protein